MSIAIVEAEEIICVSCGGTIHECGPMVKGEEHGPNWIGLKHLPNIGERRLGGRHCANA